MLELEFFGAAGEVTGSCHILRVGKRQVLLDCGMIQGGRDAETRNAKPFPFDPAEVDAVVLSHAHLDHAGRLPLLVKRGFSGSIHTQNASQQLCEILLKDAGYLQENDAARRNRHRKHHEDRVVPLYTLADAEETLPSFTGHRYHAWFDVCEGIRARFIDAGHILGSAVVEVEIVHETERRTLVFSGDLGQFDSPILRDPESPGHADLVLMESTYGGRAHRSRDDTLLELKELFRAAHAEKGNILIPAFAVGRSQEILYLFGKHYKEWGLHRWRIFLDSPMAIAATRVYWNNPHLYDEEATRLSKTMNPMPSLPNLVLSKTADDSRRINEIEAGAIIIAGSGMCTGGRILHHLKRNIFRPRARVLFTGFQAYGTLGRRIVDGQEEVRLFGDTYEVKAQVSTIGGLSAHGDADDMSHWYGSIPGTPPVYLVHGDEDAARAFKHKLASEHGAQVSLPKPGMRIDLKTLAETAIA